MKSPINATGIIWHEHLRKPPLAFEALKALKEEAFFPNGGQEDTGYGACHPSRQEELLASLTETENAMVVNNIFAAVYLVFKALAKGGKILAPDGELQLEGFSPTLGALAQSCGVQVQKTEFSLLHELDNNFDGAALLLGVFGLGDAQEGEEDILGEKLLKIGREQSIPVVKVLKNATLLDLAPFGLRGGLQVQQAVREGFDLVVFAGDRLVGGPPAGIIVGKSRYISLLRKEPLAAALSPGKMTEVTLRETLKLYFNEEEALREIPLLKMISTPAAELNKRAGELAEELEREALGRLEARVVPGESLVRAKDRSLGILPSYQVELSSPHFTARQLLEMLYKYCRPPVFPRLKKHSLLLDLRTVPKEEDGHLAASIKSIFLGKSGEDYVLDNVPMLVWVLDKEGVFMYANRACESFWGAEHGGLTGKNFREVFPGDAQKQVEEEMQKVLESGNEAHFELEINLPETEKKWLDTALSPVYSDKNKEIDGLAFTANDVTRRKTAEDELKYISMHDNLTGLYNRMYFEEEMRRLDTDRHYPVSIVVCDVDGLKLVNDLLGHEKGDELIKAAASIIKGPFRDSDVVARVGGDEFAVILPSTTVNTVEQMGDRIKGAVEEYNSRHSGVPLSISVGYATGHSPGELHEVFKKADSAMYKDKFKRTEVVKKDVFESLMSLMQEKDFMNEEEMQKLEQMVLLIGRFVGITEEEMKNILLLSRVHDIGKVSIDDSIIFKEGELSPSEWEEIKRHPEAGYRIARFWPEMEQVAPYILQHHERWDGSGYPKGLKGPEIHLYSRILAVVDAYNAMTSPRPYREALSHEEAVQELIKLKGAQFDPRLVDIFVSLVEDLNVLQGGSDDPGQTVFRN